MNALEEIERQLRGSVAGRQSPAAAVVDTSRKRRFARRPLQAAAALLAVAAIVLGVGLTTSGPTSGPSPAVAAVLQRLARIAASGPSLVPKRGQYLYVDSINDYAAIAVPGRGGRACVTYSVDHRRVWIGADGAGLLRETTGPGAYTSPSDRAFCLSAMPKGSQSPGTSNLWFAARCFQLGPTNDMQSLSTDPRTLLRQMRRIDGGPSTPAEDFTHVGDFLRETDASPALRAALYRAAALIPGVQLLGPVRDHLGRLGLGVALTAKHVRNELIFNSRTAALLGEQSSGQGPASNSWAVYLRSRIADRVPYPSPVPLTPPCVSSSGFAHNVPGGVAMTGRPVK